MSLHQSNMDGQRVPTQSEMVVFRFKTFLLQRKRLVEDLFDRELRRYPRSDEYSKFPVIAESRSRLWSENGDAERSLVAGKIQNLRLALRKLDGIEIGPNQTFSFWKQIGRATRSRGFVVGRELREGCIVPSLGGGLCQLSNALYDAALRSGFQIIERHSHTMVVAGSLAEFGKDATVFWNYVDLRFRSAAPFRLEAKLDGDDLLVRFRAAKAFDRVSRSNVKKIAVAQTPGSCMTCEVSDCHRVVEASRSNGFGKTAYLVDELWPEHDAYIQSRRTPNDTLMVPIDGKRFRRSGYSWTTYGFNDVCQSPYMVARRSLSSRRLATQGAPRQLNLIENYKKLADSYARRLTFEDLHVVVQQQLLPYLWLSGSLGGRTFDVLMTALPMFEIQARLDRAFSLHPESRTLADFRANEALVNAEREALQGARAIVTPHSEIAEIFKDRVRLLDWDVPQVNRRPKLKNHKPLIVFPATTVGRKGCYELRDAVRGLNVQLLTVGPTIELYDFWQGFQIAEHTGEWIDRADLVVLPAYVEHRPRHLLSAIASGIPVIASQACGVSRIFGVSVVEIGDAAGLREKVKEAISQCL